jgi:hypothetical protein
LYRGRKPSGLNPDRITGENLHFNSGRGTLEFTIMDQELECQGALGYGVETCDG